METVGISFPKGNSGVSVREKGLSTAQINKGRYVPREQHALCSSSPTRAGAVSEDSRVSF